MGKCISSLAQESIARVRGSARATPYPHLQTRTEVLPCGSQSCPFQSILSSSRKLSADHPHPSTLPCDSLDESRGAGALPADILLRSSLPFSAARAARAGAVLCSFLQRTHCNEDPAGDHDLSDPRSAGLLLHSKLKLVPSQTVTLYKKDHGMHA